MSGCLDNISCPGWTDAIAEKRNLIASVFSGGLFFIGWWIFIDAAVNSKFNPAYHSPGVFSTVAVFMINAVSNAQVRGESYSTGGCLGQTGARVWLLMGFLMAFGGLIAASWILFGAYVVPDNPSIWSGVAIFLQNALLFFSLFRVVIYDSFKWYVFLFFVSWIHNFFHDSMTPLCAFVFKFGRTEETW